MLQSLHIENAAVIKSLDIDFGEGFSVLSGETGAGKSIIIDSINMLSGGRVSRELIRTGEEKTTVSAVFTDCGEAVIHLLDDYGIDCDGSVMLSRTLSRDGKSVVKLNGRTVTQTLQRELCRLLINIHGQNENQRLMQKSAQIEILDSYASNQELLLSYGEQYEKLTAVRAKLSELDRDESEKIRLRDIMKFQLDEINRAKLKNSEEEQLLEAERNRLGSIERIADTASLSYRVLYGSEKGVVPLIDRVTAALSKISDVLPEAGEFSDKLSGYRYEIEDIAERIRELAEVDENPTERLNRIEGRLDTITKLKRKYGATVEDILAFRDDVATRLDAIDNADQIREDLLSECNEIQTHAEEIASEIHKKRVEAAARIIREVTQTLAFLDMPKVRFEIGLHKSEGLRANGYDDVEFLISANAGEPLMPLEKIASGGELSRMMLALKSVLSDKDGVGTVVFDEVDAGISGKTSRKVGIKLKQIAKETQVICVTHSAQIASLSDTHFLIAKHEENGRTHTEVTTLDEEGSVREIARILGGIHITESQLLAARELIEDGKAYD